MSINPYEPPLHTSKSYVDDPIHNEAPLHTVECVQFVRRAVDHAYNDLKFSPQRVANAVGVCRALLEMSVDRFGAEGKQKLIDWGIERSEDVGLIVYRLVDAGLLVATEGDSPEDFNRLFDLDLPPETWMLQW